MIYPYFSELSDPAEIKENYKLYCGIYLAPYTINFNAIIHLPHSFFHFHEILYSVLIRYKVRKCTRLDILEKLYNYRELTLQSVQRYFLSIDYMRLKYYEFLINTMSSPKTEYNEEKEMYDITKTTGIIPIVDNGKIVNITAIVKDILIQYCNCDSVESQLPQTVTTSKFNPNETFYNYLAMGWKVQVVPKYIYDATMQVYREITLPWYMNSDKELRLKDELEALRKRVPQSDMHNFFRR